SGSGCGVVGGSTLRLGLDVGDGGSDGGSGPGPHPASTSTRAVTVTVAGRTRMGPPAAHGGQTAGETQDVAARRRAWPPEHGLWTTRTRGRPVDAAWPRTGPQGG